MTAPNTEGFQAMLDTIKQGESTKLDIMKATGLPSSTVDHYIKNAKTDKLIHVSGYIVLRKIYRFGPGEDAPRPGAKDGRNRNRKTEQPRTRGAPDPFSNVHPSAFNWLYTPTNHDRSD